MQQNDESCHFTRGESLGMSWNVAYVYANRLLGMWILGSHSLLLTTYLIPYSVNVTKCPPANKLVHMKTTTQMLTAAFVIHNWQTLEAAQIPVSKTDERWFVQIMRCFSTLETNDEGLRRTRRAVHVYHSEGSQFTMGTPHATPVTSSW